MSASFVIDLWSDVVCPYCYLGARQLRQALAQFEHRDVVVLRHRAFELDPRAKFIHERSHEELVAAKYAVPVTRIRSMHERMESEARDLGMQWSLASVRTTNSFDAHRLLALATTQGLGDEASERLFRAYFCEGELISDRERLTAFADEIGVQGVEALWHGDAFSDVVRADESRAEELGISGVPSLLLDERFMVVGAQGTDHYLDILRRAWARRAA